MADCEVITDLLAEYVIGRLSPEDKAKVVLHLARCQRCRLEAAENLALKRLTNETYCEVPSDIRKNAFKKIPNPDPNLEKIIRSDSCFMVFDLLRYYLSPVKKTLEMAINNL